MIIPFWQRLITILIYMIPWSDGLSFGQNLFREFPITQLLAIPAFPVMILSKIIPFGSLIIFFLVFLLVIRNEKVPYFIRFNALQAILIDISLILISYAFQIILQPLNNYLLIRTLSTTIFLGVFACIVFSIIECLKGKEPDLPGITSAVKMQLF